MKCLATNEFLTAFTINPSYSSFCRHVTDDNKHHCHSLKMIASSSKQEDDDFAHLTIRQSQKGNGEKLLLSASLT